GNLPFFVRLRCPASVGLVAHTDGGCSEVDVRPVRVHDLLFTFTCHQEELIPELFFCVTLCKQLVEIRLLVDLRFFFGIPRPVVFAHQPTNPMRLQECHYILKLVVHAAWCLFLLVTQERGELQQVLSVDLVEVELVAGLHEVGKGGRVRCQRLGLLRELGFVEKLGDGCCHRPVPVLTVRHDGDAIIH